MRNICPRAAFRWRASASCSRNTSKACRSRRPPAALERNTMLTSDQIKARKGMMTASRIAPLMTGNVDGIMRLYQEMVGELEAEDLTGLWPVRLGEATEALNLEWFERKNNLKLAGQGVFIKSALFSWAGATLDAWCEELKCPVEAKHVG